MFGLTNAEGNHGEDVKEYYFYLDATPTAPTSVPPVSAGRVPVTPSRRHERPTRAASISSTSCSTPGSSTTTGSSTSTSSTPRPPLTTSTSASPCRIAAPRRRISICCRRCGFRNLVDGRTEGLLRRRRSGHHRGSSRAREQLELCGLTRNCCSPRTRRTPNGCGDAQHRPVREGRSIGSSSTARPTPSTPTGRAPRPPPTTGRSRPRAPRRSGCGCCRPGAKAVKPKAVGKVFADRVGEADEFYASITPAAAG